MWSKLLEQQGFRDILAEIELFELGLSILNLGPDMVGPEVVGHELVRPDIVGLELVGPKELFGPRGHHSRRPFSGLRPSLG